MLTNSIIIKRRQNLFVSVVAHLMVAALHSVVEQFIIYKVLSNLFFNIGLSHCILSPHLAELLDSFVDAVAFIQLDRCSFIRRHCQLDIQDQFSLLFGVLLKLLFSSGVTEQREWLRDGRQPRVALACPAQIRQLSFLLVVTLLGPPHALYIFLVAINGHVPQSGA